MVSLDSEKQFLEHAHARLEEILSRPEFYGIEPTLFERVGMWWQRMVDSLLSWLGGVFSRGLEFVLNDMNWLTLSLALVALGILTFYLFRQSRRWWVRERHRRAALSVAEEPEQFDAQQWLMRAQVAGEAGDYKQAVRSLYQAALAKLAATGIITIRPNATNGQYLRQARVLPPERFQPFSQLTLLFERIWYGNETAGNEEYETGRALLRSVLE